MILMWDDDVLMRFQAGYTCLMLVSLSEIANEQQKAVVRRLFRLGDVNLRAKTVCANCDGFIK